MRRWPVRPRRRWRSDGGEQRSGPPLPPRIFIGIAMFQQMPIYLIGTFPAMLLAVDNYMLRAPLLGMD